MPSLSFSPFQLDVVDERLSKDGVELKLRRKPFAILKFLALNPKRLVTQDELIEAVWGKVVMSESLLRTHVRDLRSVVGDSIIETVIGRGYRFVADVHEIASHPAAVVAADPSLLGRNDELSALRAHPHAALHRKRPLGSVTGRTGIGKPALVAAPLEPAIPPSSLLSPGACAGP